MTPREQFREGLVGCLRRELVGPDKEGEVDVLQESPLQRYSAGILFPNRQPNLELEAVSPEDAEEPEGDETEAEFPSDKDKQQEDLSDRVTSGGDAHDYAHDDSVRLANTFFPSAVGISFVTKIPPEGLVVRATASAYKSQQSSDQKFLRKWHGTPLDLPPVHLRPAPGKKRQTIGKQAASNLEVRAVFRLRKDGTHLVTVTLLNTLSSPGEGPPSGKECFFQAGFSVRGADDGFVFQEYPQVVRDASDPEEESFRLLYRNVRTFAVGHGCAPEWGDEREGRTNLVATCSVPAFKVAPIEPNEEGGAELGMLFLSGDGGRVPDGEIVNGLKNLSKAYADWIADREMEATNLTDNFRAAAKRHLAECRRCLNRMNGGIDLLQKSKRAMRAFKLTNLAILMQQYHNRERPRRFLNQDWQPLPDDYRTFGRDKGQWRCFQLAFLLTNLPSFCPEDGKRFKETRDLVDLIWFPTGGGKTEAYLGLTAFAIFMRRLTNPENGGCTVLMRYTLRLLTAQQFQRASALICACERIRQTTGDLGSDRITIGLWAGGSLTPNTRSEARSSLNALAREKGEGGRMRRRNGAMAQEQGGENKFQVLTCPWCGTAMDAPDHLGYAAVGRPRTVVMVCPERKRCPYGSLKNPLPILVIDEDIYDESPSLIIGTVDKFAMLAWRDKAGALFGLGSERQVDPPDLIIQDELHLIFGPLGSMVGLYEGAIDLLCSWKGIRPKIIASTATIRRAQAQCRSLYDRDTFQFPPPGLEASDSFFARENRESPGRVYVGVFASGAPSFVTAQVRFWAQFFRPANICPFPKVLGRTPGIPTGPSWSISTASGNWAMPSPWSRRIFQNTCGRLPAGQGYQRSWSGR